MTLTHEMLRANTEIRDMLWPFDFALVDNKEYGPVWFDTAPLQPFEIVAQRGSGCVYALVGPQRHLLLATSEGQADIMAASLREGLELIIAHPYWEELLRVGKGDLPAMRQVLRDRIEDFEDEALDDHPEIEEFRPLLRSRLGLSDPADPAGLLYQAVAVLGADLIVHDLDGVPLQSLYNWRRWR
jgi:hypothetical protein